jgi:hypothetical protein
MHANMTATIARGLFMKDLRAARGGLFLAEVRASPGSAGIILQHCRIHRVRLLSCHGTALIPGYWNLDFENAFL